MAVSLSYTRYCRCSVSQGHRRYFTRRDGTTSPLINQARTPHLCTQELLRRVSGTPLRPSVPLNFAFFLLVESVIFLVRVSSFLYFPYWSAILTAIPTLVGLLSLQLFTPTPLFSFPTLYHSSPVYAVAVSLLRCPTRDWSPRRDSGYRTLLCTLIPTGGSTVPHPFACYYSFVLPATLETFCGAFFASNTVRHKKL